MRTIKNLFKQDKEKYKVPKGVQDTIPILKVWEDGIFLSGKNKYSKSFAFTDINYTVASRQDKEGMFLEYRLNLVLNEFKDQCVELKKIRVKNIER